MDRSFLRTWVKRTRNLFGSRKLAPRIVLAEANPYLAFLLNLDLPEAEVSVGDFQGDGSAEHPPDLVIVDLGSRRATEVLELLGKVKVIGMVDGSSALRTSLPVDLDGLLLRPFAPGELFRSVRNALGIQEPPGIPLPLTLDRAQAWLGRARIASVAVAAVFELASVSLDPSRALILAAAFLYSALRLKWRLKGALGAWLEVAVATLLPASDLGFYMGFRVVSATEAGLLLGVRWGTLAGLVIGVGSSAPILDEFLSGSADPQRFIAWLLLYPVVAVAGGLAGVIWAVGQRRRSELLEEANRVLESLYRIARSMPGGLETESVTASMLEEIEEAMRASAAVILLGDAGLYTVAASFGLSPSRQMILHRNAPTIVQSSEDGARVYDASEPMPALMAEALDEYPYWVSASIGSRARKRGLILAARNTQGDHNRDRLLLQSVGQEAAMALENARLFARVRELSADEERKRLARELHDGVAQALTHIRFELEQLARAKTLDGATAREEARRVSRVLDRALGEVRSMIFGLDSSVSREGLTGAMRAYLRDLSGLGGPEIGFSIRGEIRLPAATEAEVFRIAQEAVSNAFRHAQASSVKVLMEAQDGVLKLTIIDDGTGLRKDGVQEGIGLPNMRERAERIGGDLTVEGTPGSGTRVQLELKVPAEDLSR